MPPLSLYIHIPWCLKKCPYCDFNSHAIKAETPEKEYISALLHDLATDIQLYNVARPIESIFIGGGTPSLFSPESINCLLRGLEERVALKEDLEITLEANPGTFESHKFAEFRAVGINRLSIGIQSFNDASLKKLGRVHSAADALNAVEIAHRSGFENINIDLMFGLPYASSAACCHDITTAINLEPSHISFYQLTLEPNTYFHKYPPKLPADKTIFNMQLAGQALLAESGYQQYEISAYSKVNRQCAHNLNYWQFGDYLGIGAGAHGKITQILPEMITRTSKPKKPEQYLSDTHKNGGAHSIAVAELPLEFIMNHLRLKKGFTVENYRSTTGLAIATLEPALSDCLKQGLIIQQNNQYLCSEKGWNFLDSVLQKFLC